MILDLSCSVAKPNFAKNIQKTKRENQMTKKYLQILAFSILSFSAVIQDAKAGTCCEACKNDVKPGDTQGYADCIAHCPEGCLSSVTQDVKAGVCEDACRRNVKPEDTQGYAACIAERCSDGR